jgi:hypothetical protein
MADHHQEAAQRIQEKFYFYLVGLAFTILGLSIQTSKLGEFVLSDVFELLGWISLMISGIVGLLRLEWEPYIHEKISAVNILEEDVKTLKDFIVRGEPIQEMKGEGYFSVPERLKKVQEDLDLINKGIEIGSKKSHRKYVIHKYCVIGGIVFLVISRGTFPYRNAIRCIWYSIFSRSLLY